MELQRNQLVHAVIWPATRSATVDLIDVDGQEMASFKVAQPILGSDVARWMPDGYTVSCQSCTVVAKSGAILVGAQAQFDTAVVTVRPEITFEERMERLERRERRREAREKKREEEIARLMAENEALQKEAEDEPDETVQDEAVQDETDEQEVKTDDVSQE